MKKSLKKVTKKKKMTIEDLVVIFEEGFRDLIVDIWTWNKSYESKK